MRDHETCFYCGALVAKNDREYDHFPVPREAGGVDVVCSCRTCHSMKDRFTLDSWPAEWISAIVAQFPSLNRETKLYIAKMLSVGAAISRKDS